MKTCCLALMALVLAGLPAAASASHPSPANTTYFDLAIDEPRQRLYGSDRGGGTIDVISMATLDVLSTLPVGSQPTGLDISPDGDELAVALYGQGEIAFIDLQTLSVITRVVPQGTTGPNQPYDLLYGRPGRLYSVGDPGSYGLDYVHVFDTDTKLEVGRSTEIMRAAPRLAITADKNTLYVSQVTFTPQDMYRFDITSDTPAQTAQTPSSLVEVDALCVMPDGRVCTSYGQVWSADLSTLLGAISASGHEIACAGTLDRAYASSESSIVAFDAGSYAKLGDFHLEGPLGAARVNQAETTLYVSTSSGVRALGTDFREAYLPLIRKPKGGINGQVTFNGAATPDVPLELRFYGGATWQTVASTVTDFEGYYAFLNVPGLEPGKRYYVRYRNYDGTPGYLWLWGTRDLTSYAAGSDVHIGNFDIADIALLSPADGATVALPYTFQWMRRPASPSDTYEFDLYDPADGDPYFYTDPPLGYVGGYTLSGLPARFRRGTQYAWEVWAYSPDGGYGISYDTRSVTFSSAGAGVTPAAQPARPRTSPDPKERRNE